MINQWYSQVLAAPSFIPSPVDLISTVVSLNLCPTLKPAVILVCDNVLYECDFGVYYGILYREMNYFPENNIL